MNEMDLLGHEHGKFGELIEGLFARLPLPETWREFFSHLVIDTVNIFFLLLLVMTAVYFLSSYINMDKLHHKLEHLKSVPGFLLAIAAGTLSPFCSCSIMPVLLGLISVGVPVSVCLCYLTASSLLNLTALFSLFAVAGPTFSLFYIGSSLLLIAASSLLFSLWKLDAGVRSYIDDHHRHHEPQSCSHCVWHRLKCAFLSTLHVAKSCWVYILLGVTLSSAIVAFFSLDTITKIVNDNGFFSSTLVMLIGLPIHSDIFSIAPVLALMLQISFPVALAFAVSTMALSVPSVVILTRALKAKTVAVYCATIAALALLLGWLGVILGAGS